MNIQVSRPTRFKLGDNVVTVKPHHVVRVPDALAKQLLKQVPQIQRARVKGFDRK